MFVKSTFKGVGMFKFTMAAFIMKMVILILLIMVSIPYGIEIINHIQAFVNTDANLDLFFVFKQLGWIALNLVFALILEVIIIFAIIMPIAKSQINKDIPW